MLQDFAVTFAEIGARGNNVTVLEGEWIAFTSALDEFKDESILHPQSPGVVMELGICASE
jgi:hypothetical protein